MKIRIISFTKQGSRLNQNITKELLRLGHDCECYGMEKYALEYDLLPMKESLTIWSQKAFEECEGIIYIGACGIAVRTIAPYVKDKFLDPCVLSVDEKGEYIIPLLSGHVGGGNELAYCIGKITGGIPVISTATDLNEVFAVDVFAKKNGLIIGDRVKAKEISAYLLDGLGNKDKVSNQDRVVSQGKAVDQGRAMNSSTRIRLKTDFYIDGNVPKEIQVIWSDTKNKKSFVQPLDETDIRISIYNPNDTEQKALSLIPTVTCLGIGCRKGVKTEDLEAFILEQLEKENIQIQSVKQIGSIDLKKEEEAILSLSEKYQWKFIAYSLEELQKAPGHFVESDFVKTVAGVGNVCERAAVLVSNHGTLIMNKTAKNGMTLAIAVADRRLYFE